MRSEHVVKLFARYSKSPVTCVVDLSVGVDQLVFRVDTARKSFILKVPKDNKALLQREQIATTLARRKGVLVPRVLYNGSFLVEEFVAGTMLRALPQSQKTPALYVRIGRTVRALHSVSLHGFGDLNRNGRGRFSTQRNAARARVAMSLRNCATSRLKPYAKRIRQYYAQHEHYLDGTRSVLLHNDLNDENIIVQGKSIALIDFGDAQAGTPAMDFVRPYADLRGTKNWKEFCGGYGTINEEEVQFFTVLFLVWYLNRPKITRAQVSKRLKVLRNILHA